MTDMNTVTPGMTGLKVSPIAFGTWRDCSAYPA